MKKYVITGSIGHISLPIVEGLVKEGHEVKVITSSADKSAKIESLGAKAAVGKVQDAAFIKSAFAGADVVYTMIPAIWQTTDWRASQNEIAKNYVEAIVEANIKYVVNLSSVGAHMGDGAGPVDALGDFEKMINGIKGLNVVHLRPSFFYYNLLSQIGLIKAMNFMGANYGAGEEKIVLSHTDDIAKVALAFLLKPDFTGNKVQYIASDEKNGKEISEIIGKAIGKSLNWVEFTDEQAKGGMLQAGLDEVHANGYVDLGKAMREGKMQEDYWKNKPSLGSIKLETFAQEFAAAFNA